MYNKLLISQGGGIISRQQQADQDNCATIAIGLGGTGISCLRALKKNVFTRVKPDEGTDLLPKYEHIKFLAVDTDKRSLGSTGSLETLGSDEYFDISTKDIQKTLDDSHLLYQQPELQWLKAKDSQGKGEGITPQNAEAGASGIRQVGRLLLISRCKDLVNKLTNIITDARRNLNEPSLNIHIFTGLAGGTGAGTFLDFCYILQHVLDNMGLAGVAHTCGYFFLPDVNEQNHKTGYLKSNGFASMKELDYCMNFDNNGGKWVQQYDGFKVETAKPPVKLAHLVTATQENGDIITDGYNYVMNVVADYVLEYIMKPFVPEGSKDDKEADGTFTLESHVNNITTHIGQVHKTRGGCYNYSVIGAASAYVPYKDINTYLASKIFEGFERIRDNEPSAQQIDEFVQNNGLRYEDIKKEVQKGMPDIRNYAVDADTLFDQVKDMSPDKIPGVFKKMRDDVEKGIGKIEENISAMRQDGTGKTDEASVFITSLKERVKQALIEIATDPDKGPYYASNFLSSDKANDLLNKIDGYKKQQEEDLKNLYSDLELREEEMSGALKQLQASRDRILFIRGNRDKKAEEYQNALKAYHDQLSEINVVKAMGSFFGILKEQLKELKNDYFYRFESVMRELTQTFNDNRRELSDSVTTDTGYARRIVSVADLKDSLDRVVAEMNIPDQIRKFTDNLIRKPEVWMENDDNKISAEVIDYFLKQLDKYTNMTMIEYLKNKYKTSDAAVLSKFIEDDIITNIDSRANVYMWVGKGYKMDDAVPASFLSIPYVQEIQAAATDYVGKKNDSNSWTIRPSYSSDRISLFRIKCGVPLFAYKGIENYLNDYRASKIVGQHLYEKTERDPRDSRKLINVAPLSIASPDEYSDIYIDDDDKKFIAAYDSFFDKKIITKTTVGSGVEYTLNLFDERKIDTLVEEAEGLIKEGDPFKIESFLKGLDEEGLPVVQETITINNNGYVGFEDQVIRDHIFGSQLYKEYALNSLEISDRFDKLKEELAIKSGMIKKDQNALEDFIDALKTDIIKKGDNPFKYSAETFDEDGFPDIEFDLTDSTKEPYGDKFPLYSSFLGYKELSDEDKERISMASKEKITDMEVVTNAVKGVLEDYSPDKIKAIISMTKRIDPQEGEIITEFYKNIVKTIKEFAKSFGIAFGGN